METGEKNMTTLRYRNLIGYGWQMWDLVTVLLTFSYQAGYFTEKI